MKALLSNFEKYGEVKGNITIKNAEASECDAVNSIISPKNPFSPPLLKFRMSDFENGIHNTRYANADLKEILEIYFLKKITSNKEHRLTEEHDKHEFQDIFIRKYNDSPCTKWIRAMFSDYKYGYKTVMKEYSESTIQAQKLLDYVCQAINSRYDKVSEPIQIAVLSANITGNSHYFDRNTSAGKLLIHALAFLSEIQEYKSAEKIREIYSIFSIEPDSISGAAATVGIRIYYNDKSEHAAYKIFADNSEICLISEANLIHIKYADSDTKTVYIVENQMVFSTLAEIASKYHLSIICTSGQIKTAGLKLIDMLINNNCDIYYAGDFDPEGIQIADKLLCRYNSNKFHIWRMSCDDYFSIEKSEDKISEQRLKKLLKIKSSYLKEISDLITINKKIAYQELLIPKMIDDMKSNALLHA